VPATVTFPPRHLVAFGRPGSGKSSLAERLSNDFGYTLVRTGELLRAAVRRRDSLGLRVEATLASGNLVSDAIIVELLEAELKAPEERRLLFDGFPRTLGQVAILEGFEKSLGFGIDGYLEIALTREAAEARMTGRRVCPRCGATYHLLSKPPIVPDHCDNDGASLVRRPDDAIEVVARRQQVYDDHAGPIMDYLRATVPERVYVVDGDQGPDAVYAGTLAVLGLARGE
jgi:adenylate kinase